MKAFFSNAVDGLRDLDILAGPSSVLDVSTQPAARPSSAAPSYTPSRARVAVYDAGGAAPRVEEVAQASPLLFIEALSDKVYGLAKAAGGSIPYTVIREVTENFIHADFAEPVVSVLDEGNTIRFADQGPGIADKQRAILPGFTTAKSHMKDVIRGVGSGLPIVHDFLSLRGGAVVIEDNLGCGTVVTICSHAPASELSPTAFARSATDSRPHVTHATPHVTPSSDGVYTASSRAIDALPGLGDSGLEDALLSEPALSAKSRPRLSNRQKQVLALVLENGEAGPSLVHRELGIGLSTAHRDLASLEEAGLIRSADGKRSITQEGMSYLSSPISL